MHLHHHSHSHAEPAGEARFIHALVLLFGSCFPVLGTVLIAPVLPRIQQHFAGLPAVQIMAPLALTIPSLFIGLLAPFAGAIADRFGHKRLLVAAMFAYGIFGTAPIWLENLGSIIVSRAGVGIAEAVIMTCCTALIADYFDGVVREKYLALQTVWTTAAATLFLVVGGALGEFGWRVPFWLYAGSFILALVMRKVLIEPGGTRPLEPVAASDRTDGEKGIWGKLTGICAITLVGSISFFIVQVQLGFLLNIRGIQSTQTIGLTIGLGAAMVMVGALLFRRMARFGVAFLLALSSLLSGVGYIIAGSTENFLPITIGVMIQGLGSGVMLPTLVTWAMSILRFGQRGRGSGAWNACFFIGQFVSPFVVLGMNGVTGGLTDSFMAIGWALVALGVLAALVAIIFIWKGIASVRATYLP